MTRFFGTKFGGGKNFDLGGDVFQQEGLISGRQVRPSPIGFSMDLNLLALQGIASIRNELSLTAMN